MQRFMLGLTGLAGVIALAYTMSLFARPLDMARPSSVMAKIGQIEIVQPTLPTRGVALLLSGKDGWTPEMEAIAQTLKQQGMAVAGISTPRFQKAMEADGHKCANPNWALSAVAQDFEHQLHLPHYIRPIVIGYGSGAAMAYGALSESLPGIYGGAISLSFTPELAGIKPWCKTPGLTVERTHGSTPAAKPGWRFDPVRKLSAPWVALEHSDDAARIRPYFTQIPQAQVVTYGVDEKWDGPLRNALQPMLAASIPQSTDEADLSAIPITPVIDPQAPPSNMMAVMYSGDGGWAGLDREVAAALAAKGVPVVGVDSLDYFWTARTPHEAALDLQRIIDGYGRKWHRTKVMLIGYSFGADDLPLIVDAMPADHRAAIARVSMIGLSGHADFQFHLASWIDVDGSNSVPTLPAIMRLKGMALQCIRGSKENDSACLSIPASIATKVVLPGGHHLDGNAPLIVSKLLEGLPA